jgi:predicted RNA-binding Zn ribbon-like protein
MKMGLGFIVASRVEDASKDLRLFWPLLVRIGRVIHFQKPGDPVALAVDLANTWDTLEDDPELLPDAASLGRFLSRRGYGEAVRPTSRDLAQVRALRNALRAAFTAPSEADAVTELNTVLSRSKARPELARSGDGWRITWVGTLGDSIASTTAMSLLEAIRDDGWDRFGMCAGAPCCCVFVDRSKNRSRRFCCDLCADRVAQSLHRARRRAKGK